MDKLENESREGIGSVKAAVGLYGRRNPRRKPDAYRTHITEELRVAKDEVRQLKLDMVSATEAMTKAEKAIESCEAKARSYETSAEEIAKQIEKLDEDHVFVELARIEAERELRDIEVQRETEATTFSNYIEIARKKITDLRKEIDLAKELEVNLAAANSDVNHIQNELEMVRGMPSGTPDNRSERALQETSSLLRSVGAELNEAKKELKNVKEEGFQYMFSMDLVRQELMHIGLETDRLKKIQTKSELTVENLSSKLLKANSKLESTIVSNERANSIVSNLASALLRMEAEITVAKQEKEVITKELETIQMEKAKAEVDIKEAEEGLNSSMQELETVKKSEGLAMKKLKHVRERIIRSRTSSSPHGSTITIPKFEYDYIRRRAAAAKLVADMKVAAAHAWIESLKAGEKEIMMKSEFIARETEEIKVVEEQEMKDDEMAEPSTMQLVVATPRKSMRENRTPATVRRAKVRRLSTSPGTLYNPRSPSFAMKRRTKVLPKFNHVSQPLEKLLRSE